MLTVAFESMKNSMMAKENVGKLIPLPKCAACDSKISRLIKNQKVTGLLSSSGLKTLLSKIPLSGEFLF